MGSDQATSGQKHSSMPGLSAYQAACRTEPGHVTMQVHPEAPPHPHSPLFDVAGVGAEQSGGTTPTAARTPALTPRSSALPTDAGSAATAAGGGGKPGFQEAVPQLSILQHAGSSRFKSSRSTGFGANFSNDGKAGLGAFDPSGAWSIGGRGSLEVGASPSPSVAPASPALYHMRRAGTSNGAASDGGTPAPGSSLVDSVASFLAHACMPAEGPGPGRVLLFNGLRVRIGISTGVRGLQHAAQGAVHGPCLACMVHAVAWHPRSLAWATCSWPFATPQQPRFHAAGMQASPTLHKRWRSTAQRGGRR